MDGKPACRYGSACYRRNPEHFARFAHPPGVERRNEKRAGAGAGGPSKRARTAGAGAGVGADADDAAPRPH